MADTFTLEIATPAEIIVSDEVETVTAPGTEGEFGVLREHTEFLTALRIGEVSYKKDDKTVFMAVGPGYAEVGPEKTTILVDSVVMATDIDLAAVTAEVAEAEKVMTGLTEDDETHASAFVNLEMARAKVAAAEKAKAG